MPYVQRDVLGKIIGRFRQPQEGYATEFLEDDHPDLVATLVNEARRRKLAEINDAFESAAAQLTSAYPASEKLTWPIQEQEALAWQANNLALTPYIDQLAGARGIARADYLTRTLAKVNAFRAASATLVGTRQKYQDQASVASSMAAIDAVQAVF